MCTARLNALDGPRCDTAVTAVHCMAWRRARAAHGIGAPTRDVPSARDNVPNCKERRDRPAQEKHVTYFTLVRRLVQPRWILTKTNCQLEWSTFSCVAHSFAVWCHVLEEQAFIYIMQIGAIIHSFL
jgi:hypothetical protein